MRPCAEYTTAKGARNNGCRAKLEASEEQARTARTFGKPRAAPFFVVRIRTLDCVDRIASMLDTAITTEEVR
jgi:hypothetical protein